jgi:hypothetical protein
LTLSVSGSLSKLIGHKEDSQVQLVEFKDHLYINKMFERVKVIEDDARIE